MAPLYRPWRRALLASFGLHAVAFALCALAFAAEKPLRHFERRDTWTGNAVEISDLRDVSPAATRETPVAGRATTSVAETAPVTAVRLRAEVPAAPAKLPRAETATAPARPLRADVPHAAAATSAPEDPMDALARRILAYEPGHASEREANETASATEAHDPSPSGTMPGPTEVRVFARAFTRAIPAADSGDATWDRLPVGPLESAHVAIEVDAQGTVGDATFDEERSLAPSVLKELVKRTLALLRGGRFSVTRTEAAAEKLRIDATLSDRPIEDGPLALGFEPPTPRKAGRAYFQRPSGRFVEVRVTIEPS